jgi:hypothetical protein
MSQAKQLRQRIQWLKDALATCQDGKQRETLIGRLLDTQDQLMFLNMARLESEDVIEEEPTQSAAPVRLPVRRHHAQDEP